MFHLRPKFATSWEACKMVGRYLSSLIFLYIVLIFIRILATWFGGKLSHSVQNLLSPLVDPYLLVIGRVIPPFGAIDFSPTIGVIILLVLQNYVAQLPF